MALPGSRTSIGALTPSGWCFETRAAATCTCTFAPLNPALTAAELAFELGAWPGTPV